MYDKIAIFGYIFHEIKIFCARDFMTYFNFHFDLGEAH